MPTATQTQLGHDLSVGVGRLSRVLARETSELSRAALAGLGSLRHGPRRSPELAAAEHVAQPTMTVLVSRLEARRWVDRRPDERDGRAANVVLTDAGSELVDEVLERRAAFLAARIASLSRDERRALAAAVPILERLAEAA